jgi:geranylgeranyl diphosphate synthase type II
MVVPLTTSEDLTQYLASRGRLVDAALHRYLPPEHEHPAIIHEAMRYALFAGGKWLRPTLVLASTEACGAAPEPVLPIACAMELIHTYSLIHDDLPAMDDSDTRRGRPTCHIAFGEAIAVLAGDALHALAFDLIGRSAESIPVDRALRVSREIAEAIGTAGMVGGQVLDLLGEAPTRTFPGGTAPPERPLTEVVREIHLRKTAALIRGCVRAGAIVAGAAEEILAALTTYGERIGLVYQIIDDVLDVVGEEAKLGKRTGSDASKATYPAAFGIPRSREIAATLTAEAQQALRPLGRSGDILRELAGYLLRREA